MQQYTYQHELNDKNVLYMQNTDNTKYTKEHYNTNKLLIPINIKK